MAQVLQNDRLKLVALIALVFALVMSALAPGVSAAKSNLTAEEKGEIILNAVFYDTSNDSFVVESDILADNGFNKKEIKSITVFFKGKNGQEVADQFGVDIDATEQTGDVQTYFLPAILIPIGQWLVGAAVQLLFMK